MKPSSAVFQQSSCSDLPTNGVKEQENLAEEPTVSDPFRSEQSTPRGLVNSVFATSEPQSALPMSEEENLPSSQHSTLTSDTKVLHYASFGDTFREESDDTLTDNASPTNDLGTSSSAVSIESSSSPSTEILTVVSVNSSPLGLELLQRSMVCILVVSFMVCAAYFSQVLQTTYSFRKPFFLT